MLDIRKNRILQAIVHDYVETAEPIGSEWLASHHDFGCKSATLRNEMAEMSDRGYLLQPYTSAGRIPSNLGYRYYVDCLMPPVPAAAGGALEELAGTALDLHALVQLSCRMLADLTHYPSVATSPAACDVRVQRIYVTPATDSTVLVVLLLSSGHVEHRIVEHASARSAAALHRVTNYLNERLAGCALTEVGVQTLGATPTELARDRALLARAHAAVVATVRGLTDNRLFLEGTTHILRQREFQDVLRLEQLLSALEQRSVLYQVMSRAIRAAQPTQQSHGDQVAVLIGSESALEAMADCSVVTSQYRIAGRVGGFIGVVGPTRMHYGRTVSAVGMMARSLTALLSRGAPA